MVWLGLMAEPGARTDLDLEPEQEHVRAGKEFRRHATLRCVPDTARMCFPLRPAGPRGC
jgi:hypothetical protein